MNRQIRGSIMLFMTALIWGTAFVAQKSGMDTVSPVAFNGIRTLIGAVSLLPVIAIMNMRQGAKAENTKEQKKLLWIGGVCGGLFLMAAGNVQQIGICYTTAGKTGFITALYVILVPLMGLLLGKRIRPIFWACVAASAVGLYLLCIPAEGGFGNINKGDIIVFICAFLFAGHILCIDYFSPKVDGVKLSCIQFFVAGGVSCILMLFIDPALGYTLPTLSDLQAGWFPLFYAGVMSCGVAYTCQIIGQKGLNPTVASLIMSLESSISVIAGWLFLGQRMGSREILGCVVMFAAIVLAQLPEKRRKTRIPDERSRSARLRPGREW